MIFSTYCYFNSELLLDPVSFVSAVKNQNNIKIPFYTINNITNFSISVLEKNDSKMIPHIFLYWFFLTSPDTQYQFRRSWIKQLKNLNLFLYQTLNSLQFEQLRVYTISWCLYNYYTYRSIAVLEIFQIGSYIQPWTFSKTEELSG